MAGPFMPRLSREQISAVKARHPMHTVLPRMGIELPAGWAGGADVRAGCPCPNCPGKHTGGPSFIARADDESWWCFRQNAGGDVIELVRQRTGISSVAEAARVLDAGGPIAAGETPEGGTTPAERSTASRAFTEQPDLERTPTGRVMEVNAAAWRFYTLPKLAERAQKYLADRGIDISALLAESGGGIVGHTPRSGTGLVDNLRRRGFTDDELVDAGWGRRLPGEGEVTDRYRGRLLLPFRGDAGRVTGVTGRAVHWTPGDKHPKYLNHGHTTAFDKSRSLYRPMIRPLGPHATVIAVEGTLDALAIAAAASRHGWSHLYAPVTQSGLSLTEEVTPRVLALHPAPPILCADGDEPGQAATAAWARRVITKHGREVCTLTLPDGMDPAEWLGAHGDMELRAFTRRGCLTDTENVRARPAGELLAMAALRDATRAHPDKESWELAGLVYRPLSKAAAALPDEAARARFVSSAAGALAAKIDGLPAQVHAAEIRSAASVGAVSTARPFDPALLDRGVAI